MRKVACVARTGIPNGPRALIAIPGPPPLQPCHLCYSRQESAAYPSAGSQIALSWPAQELNKKWKLLPRKVSEELTSDGGGREREGREEDGEELGGERRPAAYREEGGLGCIQKDMVL